MTTWNNAALRSTLVADFSLVELQSAAYDLGFDGWESADKPELALKLMQYLAQRGQVGELIDWLQRHRGDIDIQPFRLTSGVAVNASTNEGLFLTRLLNPQQLGKADITSTVWLNVRGDTQYTVDSLHIHVMVHGPAGPVGVVALPPDAEYRFTYNDNTNRVEALNPALSIGPHTRREASFTLSTAPDQGLYMISELGLWLQYHTSDGRTGTLFLGNPAPEGVFLCRLLGQPVKVIYRSGGDTLVEQLVAPPGITQGIDEQTDTPVQFQGLDRLGGYFDAASLAELRTGCQQILARRARLHQAIVASGRLHDLMSEMNKGAEFAGDLVGAIGSPECTQAVLDLLANDPANSAAWLGLCIRHIVTQDSLLVDQVLKTTPQHPVTDFSDPRNQAETTLRAYPVERSKDALAALKWVDPSTPAATNRPRRRHSR